MIVFSDKTAISFEDYIKSSHKHYDVRVAIPSYKRASTIRKKTLPLLERSGVKSSIVDIFVASEDEKRIYENELGGGFNIVVGVKGMKNIRNFMVDYYQQNQRVMFMDDDLSAIFIAHATDREGFYNKQPLAQLMDFFDYGFELLDELNAGLFGVYPIDKPLFMKRQIKVGLSYIIGCFYGMVINHHQSLKVNVDDKEDFERSLRSYLYYGKAVRVNYVGVSTNYFTESGGMQIERNASTIKHGAEYMLRTFPQYVFRNTRVQRENEIKLVDKRDKFKTNNYTLTLI